MRHREGAIIKAAHRVVRAILASPQSAAKLSCNQSCICQLHMHTHVDGVFESKDRDIPVGQRFPQGHVERERDSLCGLH